MIDAGRLRIRSGAVFGMPAMKFALTYEGNLPSRGNASKTKAIWAIRRAFAPQLADLWSSHPAMKAVLQNRYFPMYGGATLAQTHHQHGGAIVPSSQTPANDRSSTPILDLCAPVEKYGVWFRPLVRESFALHCGLKIKFLRKEMPGRLYQGGDLDGRMKTLLDALAMPQHKEQMPGCGDEHPESAPLLCLLEDDDLVSGIDIESERLLGPSSDNRDWARLLIEVDVRVRQATIYNHSFLG